KSRDYYDALDQFASRASVRQPFGTTGRGTALRGSIAGSAPAGSPFAFVFLDQAGGGSRPASSELAIAFEKCAKTCSRSGCLDLIKVGRRAGKSSQCETNCV